MSVYGKKAILRKVQMSVNRRVYFQRTVAASSDALEAFTAPALQKKMLNQLINPL